MGYTVHIPEGERGMFFGGITGKDNYGAGRTVAVHYRDTASTTEKYLLSSVSVDNALVSLGKLLDPATAAAVGAEGLPFMPWLMHELGLLSILGGSLANTETLTSVLWIATRVLPPIVTAVGAGVTITTETIVQV